MNELQASFIKCKLSCFIILVDSWEGWRMEGWVALPPGHRFYGDAPVRIPITPEYTMCADVLRVGPRVMTQMWFLGRAYPSDTPIARIKSEMRRMVEDLTAAAKVKVCP